MADLKLTKEVNKKIDRKSATAVLPHRYEPKEWPPLSENVDMCLYELLTRDVKAMKESIRLKNLLLYEKDAAIEAIEHKMKQIVEENGKQSVSTEEVCIIILTFILLIIYLI